MKIDVSEITGLLKQEISRYQAKLDVVKVGRVVEVGDGIARIYGLEGAQANEMLLFENDMIGEVFNLEEDSLAAVIYGDYTKVREGSDVRSTGRLITGAALIMVAVFAGFAAGDLVMFQEMGFGAGVAVLIDATIVRSILVPASMRLLGDWNWYLPRWLRWLPDVRVETAPGGAPRQWSPAAGGR
jgi:RND superfamily putative drug exporter